MSLVRMRSLLLICVCITLLFGGAVQAAEQKETSIYLKIGKYFILYTKPHPPFVDSNKRLLLPLRSFQDLMGGTVTYDSSSKTATVNWLDHSFQLTINSNTAKVDGHNIEMDTIPLLKDGAMFLPVRLFLNQTNVKYTWDQKKQLLHITDERVVVGQPFEDFEGNDLFPQNIDGAFHLISYQLSSKNGVSTLSIKAKNITGEDIPKGKSDIHPLVSYDNNGGFSTDSYSRPVYPELPEVKEGDILTVTQRFDLKNIAYIISVGRKEP